MKILRLILSIYAFLCLISGISLIIFPKSSLTFLIGIYLLINASVIFMGTLFEKRYKTKSKNKTGLKPTGERFINHSNGKVVEVHFDPKTGERSYIEI